MSLKRKIIALLLVILLVNSGYAQDTILIKSPADISTDGLYRIAIENGETLDYLFPDTAFFTLGQVKDKRMVGVWELQDRNEFKIGEAHYKEGVLLKEYRMARDGYDTLVLYAEFENDNFKKRLWYYSYNNRGGYGLNPHYASKSVLLNVTCWQHTPINIPTLNSVSFCSIIIGEGISSQEVVYEYMVMDVGRKKYRRETVYLNKDILTMRYYRLRKSGKMIVVSEQKYWKLGKRSR